MKLVNVMGSDEKCQDNNLITRAIYGFIGHITEELRSLFLAVFSTIHALDVVNV